MSSKKGNILIIVPTIIAVVAVIATAYLFYQNQQLQNYPIDVVKIDNKAPDGKKLYFGKSISSGDYIALNLLDGTTTEIVPPGYKIISFESYDIFPSYLILEKDNQLFSYQIENKLINDVFPFPGLHLKKDEHARAYQSITEKDKFFIIIDTYDEEELMGMGLPNILNSRYYFFNASTNKSISTSDKGFNNYQTCYQYDSKNSRFFIWPCGEGIGETLPISTTDLDGRNKKEIVSESEIDTRAEVHYRNNQFVVITYSYNPKEIIFLNPFDLNREQYYFTEDAISQIKDPYGYYSMVVSKQNKTIVVGGSSYIMLLKFDSSNKITEVKYIPDAEIYANFVFLYQGKAYYQAKDAVRVINLDTWKVEKSWPSTRDEALTLFML